MSYKLYLIKENSFSDSLSTIINAYEKTGDVLLIRSEELLDKDAIIKKLAQKQINKEHIENFCFQPLIDDGTYSQNLKTFIIIGKKETSASDLFNLVYQKMKKLHVSLENFLASSFGYDLFFFLKINNTIYLLTAGHSFSKISDFIVGHFGIHTSNIIINTISSHDWSISRLATKDVGPNKIAATDTSFRAEQMKISLNRLKMFDLIKNTGLQLTAGVKTTTLKYSLNIYPEFWQMHQTKNKEVYHVCLKAGDYFTLTQPPKTFNDLIDYILLLHKIIDNKQPGDENQPIETFLSKSKEQSLTKDLLKQIVPEESDIFILPSDIETHLETVCIDFSTKREPSKFCKDKTELPITIDFVNHRPSSIFSNEGHLMLHKRVVFLSSNESELENYCLLKTLHGYLVSNYEGIQKRFFLLEGGLYEFDNNYLYTIQQKNISLAEELFANHETNLSFLYDSPYKNEGDYIQSIAQKKIPDIKIGHPRKYNLGSLELFDIFYETNQFQYLIFCKDINHIGSGMRHITGQMETTLKTITSSLDKINKKYNFALNQNKIVPVMHIAHNNFTNKEVSKSLKRMSNSPFFDFLLNDLLKNNDFRNIVIFPMQSNKPVKQANTNRPKQRKLTNTA